jgi:hypothetical protein
LTIEPRNENKKSMTSRREFLSGGAAVCALTAGQLGSAASLAANVVVPGAATRESLALIYDSSLPQAQAFGTAAAGLGARAVGVTGDLGSTWMNFIEPAFRAGAGTIAGMTAAATLFCLEYMGRDYGMRVVYRIEHEPLDGGGYRHRLCGAEELADASVLLHAAGPDWPAVAAALAARGPAAGLPTPALPLVELQAQAAGTPPRLFTWLMAPAYAAAASRAPLGA